MVDAVVAELVSGEQKSQKFTKKTVIAMIRRSVRKSRLYDTLVQAVGELVTEAQNMKSVPKWVSNGLKGLMRIIKSKKITKDDSKHVKE